MSDTSIQAYSFEGNQVRTFQEENGNILFCGTDVARTLGYRNVNDAIGKHCKGVVKRYPLRTPGGFQQVRFISEGDVYRLIASSRLPEAEKFESWIFDEVIPQIRRTGGYIPVAEQDDEKVILSKAVLILNRTLGEKDRLLADRQKTIDRQRPLAALGESFLSVDGTMTITKAARHFQTIDRTMTRDMVFGLLRGAGYLEQAGNAPTVKAIRPGYLKQKVAKRRDGRMGRPYAVFTPKGINWFIRRFIYAEGQGQFDMEVAA